MKTGAREGQAKEKGELGKEKLKEKERKKNS